MIEKFSKKYPPEPENVSEKNAKNSFFLNHFKLLFSDAEENGYLAHIKDTDLPSLVEWLKTKHQVT